MLENWADHAKEFRFAIRLAAQHFGGLKATKPRAVEYLYQQLEALGASAGRPVPAAAVPEEDMAGSRPSGMLEYHRAAFEFPTTAGSRRGVRAESGGRVTVPVGARGHAPPRWSRPRRGLRAAAAGELLRITEGWARKLAGTSWQDVYAYFMTADRPAYAQALINFAAHDDAADYRRRRGEVSAFSKRRPAPRRLRPRARAPEPA